jgi:flagellar L-ring protein precursor FlgH
MIVRIIVLGSLLLISGCSALLDSAEQVAETADKAENSRERQVSITTDNRSPIPDDPFYAPIEPAEPPAQINVTGSLFSSSSSSSMYSYIPLYAVGDTLTVLLDEEASAQKSAASNLATDNSYELEPITVPGGTLSINGNEVEFGLNQTQDFGGASDADQSHSLSAKLTVSVVNILTNGNLVVRGEKWLVINNGKEYMRVTGIVRPKDISEQNTISSYQIADARIEFSGTGDQADVQTQGWLSSLFNGSLWPF